MTSQWCHRNKTHSWYSELKYLQNIYFGFFIFGRSFITYLLNNPRRISNFYTILIYKKSQLAAAWAGRQSSWNVWRQKNTTTGLANLRSGNNTFNKAAIYMYNKQCLIAVFQCTKCLIWWPTWYTAQTKSQILNCSIIHTHNDSLVGLDDNG